MKTWWNTNSLLTADKQKDLRVASGTGTQIKWPIASNQNVNIVNGDGEFVGEPTGTKQMRANHHGAIIDSNGKILNVSGAQGQLDG